MVGAEQLAGVAVGGPATQLALLGQKSFLGDVHAVTPIGVQGEAQLLILLQYAGLVHAGAKI